MSLDGNYVGVVDNDLLCTKEHGLSDGDTIAITMSEVIGVLPA